MTVHLSEDPPFVAFICGRLLRVSCPQLRDLLRANGTESASGADWNFCQPTSFGYGLCADWLEDRLGSLPALCDFSYFDSHFTAEEILGEIIRHCRNYFKLLMEVGK